MQRGPIERGRKWRDVTKNGEDRLTLEPPAFWRTLDPDERMLVNLRDDLYEASWERMAGDLRRRLAGQPYIYKLANKIEDDLARIAFLRAYEARWSVDLGQIAEQA